MLSVEDAPPAVVAAATRVLASDQAVMLDMPSSEESGEESGEDSDADDF